MAFDRRERKACVVNNKDRGARTAPTTVWECMEYERMALRERGQVASHAGRRARVRVEIS